MSSKIRIACLAAASIAALACGAASAQQASQAPTTAQDTADDTSGEIIVTATRKEQSITKVPISITAFNQESLDKQGVKSIDDITRFTPGLTFSRVGFATVASISIRGIDSDVGAGTVGIYIDDTPIQSRVIGPNTANVYPALFDLERVEVLRGPQGTLFGAGSEGGTVRFITPEPSLSEWRAYGRAEISQTDGGGLNYESGLAIGVPVVKDKLGVRASAWWRRDGGWIDRVDQDTFAVLDKNANKAHSFVTRVAAVYAPTDALRISPSVLYQNLRLSDIGTFWDRNEAGQRLSLPEQNIYRNGQALLQPNRDRLVLPALKVEYAFDGIDLISNTSYFSRRQERVDDYTNLIAGLFLRTNRVPIPGYISYAPVDNRYKGFTQEVRLQSSNPAARLNWVLGIFYNRSVQTALQTIVDPQFEEAIGFPLELFAPGAPELLPGGLTLDARSRFVDKQIAGFADVTYELLEGLKVTAGLRVARASIDGHNIADGPFAGTHVDVTVNTKETPVTPKVGVNWQIDDANLLYATAAKGYRAGGLNLYIPPVCAPDLALRGLTEAPPTYGSDSVWSYEIGTKNRLFGGATQIAASAFHIVWKNIQRNEYLTGCAFNYVTNQGTAHSNGFDLQITQRIGDRLTLSGSLGYTDARFTETILGPANATTGTQPVIVRKGNSVLFQPWSATASAEYVQPIGSNDLFARMDFQYRGGRRLTPSTDPTVTTFSPNRQAPDPTNTVNVRVGYRTDRIDLSLFATNLFNDHPRLSYYREGGDPVYRVSTLTPRTIGITGTYRY